MRQRTFRLVALIVGLSLVDGVFSLVRAGHFVELNPLARPLLQGRPFAFVALKLVGTLVGVGVLARSRRRSASWLLGACAACYAVIDGYWLLT